MVPCRRRLYTTSSLAAKTLFNVYYRALACPVFPRHDHVRRKLIRTCPFKPQVFRNDGRRRKQKHEFVCPWRDEMFSPFTWNLASSAPSSGYGNNSNHGQALRGQWPIDHRCTCVVAVSKKEVSADKINKVQQQQQNRVVVI